MDKNLIGWREQGGFTRLKQSTNKRINIPRFRNSKGNPLQSPPSVYLFNFLKQRDQEPWAVKEKSWNKGLALDCSVTSFSHKYGDFQSPGGNPFIQQGFLLHLLQAKSGRGTWGLERTPGIAFRLNYVALLFSLVSREFRVRGEGSTLEGGWSHLIFRKVPTGPYERKREPPSSGVPINNYLCRR